MGILNRLFGSTKSRPVPRPLFTLRNAQQFFVDCLPFLNERDGPEFAKCLSIFLIPFEHAALEYNPECGDGFGDIIQNYAAKNRDHAEERLEVLEDTAAKMRGVGQAAFHFLMGHLIVAFVGTGLCPVGQNLTAAMTDNMVLLEQGAKILLVAGSYAPKVKMGE